MSDRRRHRAFALSVLFAAVVCVLVWWLERPRQDGRAQAAPKARSEGPLVLGSETTHAAGAEGSPQASRGAAASAAIVATARHFTLAFLEYQVDSISAAVRQTIESTATPSFAHSLLSAPPRLPRGMPALPPERLRSLALANGPQGGQAAVAVELLGAEGRISSLYELLERSGRGWRVSSLD